MNSPNNNNKEKKLDIKLVRCTSCKNPFFIENPSMVKKGEKLKELVCENCIKLGQRKRELQIGVFEKVIEVENKMEDSIKEMKNQLTLTKGKFNKQFYLENIKRRNEVLTKSIELIEKIEETNDEKYIEDFKKLFEKLKRDHS